MGQIILAVILLLLAVCSFGVAVFVFDDKRNRTSCFYVGVLSLMVGVVFLSLGIEDETANPSIPIGVEMRVVANYEGPDANKRIVLQWANDTDENEPYAFQQITVPETRLNGVVTNVGTVLIRVNGGNVISLF